MSNYKYIKLDRFYKNVWFNQKKDKPVINVKDKFEDAYVNKMVVIAFEEKVPLGVTMNFAARLGLEDLDTSNLYFYSYNPVTNIYTEIKNPGYWLDKNGYSQFRGPLGGSIIITDSPLTLKTK